MYCSAPSGCSVSPGALEEKLAGTFDRSTVPSTPLAGPSPSETLTKSESFGSAPSAYSSTQCTPLLLTREGATEPCTASRGVTFGST